LHMFINTNPAVNIYFFQGLAVGNKQFLCYHLGEVKYRMLSKKLLCYPRICHYFGILDFTWLTFICNWLSNLMSCGSALNDITGRQMETHTCELLYVSTGLMLCHKKTPWLLVRKWTIPTERPPLVGEISANFCG
jgi:hypothetical protein